MANDWLPNVKKQYEGYPYPPRIPEHESKRLIETQGDFLDVINYHCFGGKESFSNGFRTLVAGCGTGDGVVFLSEQLRDTNAEVVALDFSETSLSVARRRCELRRITNVRFVRAAIEQIPSLSLGEFDYISCSGVLHHLANPVAGMRVLANALKPHGAIFVMLYATHGRAPVYVVQDLLRRLAGAGMPVQSRLDLARTLVHQLPETNPFKRDYRHYGSDIEAFGDAGLHDLLLHSQDRSYTVPQVYELVQQAGLHLITFDTFGGGGKRKYEPSTYLSGAQLLSVLATKDPAERHAIAELVAGNMATHAFYAGKNPCTPPSPHDKAAIPFISAAWAPESAHLQLAEMLASKPNEPQTFSLRNTGSRITVTPTKAVVEILKLTDGENSVDKVVKLAAARTGLQEEIVLDEFLKLFDAFNAFDWMLLRLNGSKRMASGEQLQNQMLRLRDAPFSS